MPPARRHGAAADPSRVAQQPRAAAPAEDDVQVVAAAAALLVRPLVVVLAVVLRDESRPVHQLGRDLHAGSATGREKPPRPHVARCAAWVRYSRWRARVSPT